MAKPFTMSECLLSRVDLGDPASPSAALSGPEGWRRPMRAVALVVGLLALLFTPPSSAAAAGGEHQGQLESRHEAITTTPDLTVPMPKGTNRVTAAAVFHPSTAAPGDTVTVLAKVRVAPGHWIYALDNSGSRNLATAIITPSDSPFQLAGPWRGSHAKVKEDGSRIYAGELVLQGRFQLDRGAQDGIQKLPITLTYQVCNEALCWPPATISLEPALKVLRSR